MIKNEENPLVQDISAKLSKTNKIKNGKMLGGQNAKITQNWPIQPKAPITAKKKKITTTQFLYSF